MMMVIRRKHWFMGVSLEIPTRLEVYDEDESHSLGAVNLASLK